MQIVPFGSLVLVAYFQRQSIRITPVNLLCYRNCLAVCTLFSVATVLLTVGNLAILHNVFFSVFVLLSICPV